jgi:cystathionine beta-lyase
LEDALDTGQHRRSFLRTAGFAGGVLALGPLASGLATGARAAVVPAGGGYDFDTTANRLHDDSTKWSGALRTEHIDHIVAGMGIADMDFHAAPAITAALRQAVQYDNWGYIDLGMPGRQAWLQSIVDWNHRRYGITAMSLANMDITTGVHAGIVATLRAFCPEGSKVLMATPIYNGFYGDLAATRTIANESLLKWVGGRPEIDWDDLERRAAMPDTKVTILCNPHNPVGRAWSREELTRYGEICLRHGVLVLADEIHCDFIHKGETYTPFSTLADKDLVHNSITFKSVSKSFSLAGMKCAWFFSTNPRVYKAVTFYNHADLNTLGMAAAEAAYAGGEAWLNDCVAYISDNQDFANAYIKQHIPMFEVGQTPQGTYLVWVDVTALADRIGARKLADDANQQAADAAAKAGADASGLVAATPEDMVQHWLAQHAYVQLTAGAGFGMGGANHMRMNIATSRGTLKAALDSLSGALGKLAA